MQSTGLMVFWFMAVVVMIPVALWLLKRSGLAHGALGGANALIKPVGQFNVGQGQRVVTVEVNAGGQRTWLVLGVTAQSITPLHSLTPTDEEAAPAAPAHGVSPFPMLLRRSTDAMDALKRSPK